MNFVDLCGSSEEEEETKYREDEDGVIELIESDEDDRPPPPKRKKRGKTKTSPKIVQKKKKVPVKKVVEEEEDDDIVILSSTPVRPERRRIEDWERPRNRLEIQEMRISTVRQFPLTLYLQSVKHSIPRNQQCLVVRSVFRLSPVFISQKPTPTTGTQ